MRQIFFLIVFCFLIVDGKTTRLRQEQQQPCSSGDGPDCIYIPWKANAMSWNHTV